MNKVYFFEGSYPYNVVSTDLNITEDYILMKLAKQYEYRPTTESLWAEVVTPESAIRYELDYDNKRVIPL